MTAAHTNRGKTTERMVVRWARDHGYPHAERVRRTGYTVHGRTDADEGDIDLAPGVVIQVKALRPASRAERAIGRWMAETEAQRHAGGADLGILVVRRDGTADVGEWWAWLPLTSLELLRSDGTLPPADTTPVRLQLGHLVTLLRAAGYGSPATEEVA
jgi:hypothetical protein